MAEPPYLFWLDTETSGLLDEAAPPTCLEMAWTITDRAGRQLAPLCQAFTAVTTDEGPLTLPEPDGDGGSFWWDHLHRPSAAVREMHDLNHSGLADEWVTAAETRPDRILRDWAEIERVWLDYLGPYLHGLGPRQMILAGGGVSHYEDRFVRQQAPRVFARPAWHYGLCDVSTVLRVHQVREPSLPGKADEVLAAIDHDGPGVRDALHIALSNERYDSDDRCGYTRHATGGESVTPHWALLERDNHRAAPGIARALMAYRLLDELPHLHSTPAELARTVSS
jgi:oligoribonuclease (3'-5' exoribonuclease)